MESADTTHPQPGRGAPRVRPIQYPIVPQALANWWKFDMTRRPAPGGGTQYTFRCLGSTCTNCGTPIDTRMHALLTPDPRGVIVERAWIEFAPEDEGHPRMCEYGVRGKRLLEDLRQPAPFCGQTLEEAIAGLTDINPAGCFCTSATTNHKWRQMLCAIHYGLSHEKV